MTVSITAQVDHLFSQADDRHEKTRRNPVTGSTWLRGVDPVAPQKRVACDALLAREQFGKSGPTGIELPLSYEERERLKDSNLGCLVAWFARSLAHRDFDLKGHPSFEIYARGVLASSYTPKDIKADVDLLRRYPPHPLPGLESGLIWRSGC